MNNELRGIVLATALGLMGQGVWMPKLAVAQVNTPAATDAASPDNPELAEAEQLNTQALQLYNQGKYSEAIPLAEQALAIRQRILDDHPHTATSLNNLAGLYSSMGRYSEAEPLYVRSLSIIEQQLGADHPDTASSLNNLAALYWAKGDTNRAIDFLNRGLAAQEKNLTVNLIAGSERQKRQYLDTISYTLDLVISLHLNAAPNNPQAARLATTALLQRQGRILDVFTNSLQLLRQHSSDPKIQQLLDNYSATITQRANLEYNTEQLPPEAYRAQLATLNEQITQLEAQLSRRSAEFASESQPVTLETIQPLIPADAALVQLVRYQPFDPQAPQDERYGAPRYAAYLLTATGEPQGIDLGDAATIETAVESFRQVLRDKDTPDPQLKQAARQLDTLLMQPIRPLLGNTRYLLLALDGALNLIPFEALVDENGNYLVETYSFSYLTARRDLLRLQAEQTNTPSTQPVILANPFFQKPGDVVTAVPPDNQSDNTRSIDLSQLDISPLDGTKLEAEAIASLLGVTSLLGSQATEAAVKQANRPRLLHIATHGFFEPAPTTPEAQATDNPFLRAGLVLAGVNLRQSGGEGLDGILTAMETASLNLVGTKLVVLSACNTGVGDISAGEGIYGLRRALVLAGSQSQVISLWKVDDTATKGLMVAYYNRVLVGEGRGEALRQEQLAMLKGDT